LTHSESRAWAEAKTPTRVVEREDYRDDYIIVVMIRLFNTSKSTVSIIESHQEYQAALKFAREYEPDEDKDYQWVFEHAEKEYNRLDGIATLLDGKADGMVRYLGTLVSALTPAFAYLARSNVVSPIVTGPTLVLMVCSLVAATKARMPAVGALPLSTQRAFDYADYFSEKTARVAYAAMTNTASVFTRLVNEEKAAFIQWSMRFFWASLGWLVFAFSAAAVFGNA
jgi:hypothetical protein